LKVFFASKRKEKALKKIHQKSKEKFRKKFAKKKLPARGAASPPLRHRGPARARCCRRGSGAAGLCRRAGRRSYGARRGMEAAAGATGTRRTSAALPAEDEASQDGGMRKWKRGKEKGESGGLRRPSSQAHDRR